MVDAVGAASYKEPYRHHSSEPVVSLHKIEGFLLPITPYLSNAVFIWGYVWKVVNSFS